MITMNLLTINGVDTGGDSSSSGYIPNPSTYKCKYEDIDYNSQRATNGTMHRNVVATKRTIDITWDKLNKSQAESIGQAIAPPSFSASLYDPLVGASSSGTFYAGDKEFTGITIKSETDAFWSVSFSLIEM